MAEEQQGFWTSMPGILTGLATFMTAITGLYMAVSGDGRNGQGEPAPAAQTVSAAVQPGAGPAPSSQPSQRPQDIFRLTAVIDDPDGFSCAARSPLPVRWWPGWIRASRSTPTPRTATGGRS